MSGHGRHDPVTGVLWMVGAAASFSVALALVRHLSDSFSVFEITFFRLAFGTIVILPPILRGGARTRNLPLYCGRALFTFAAVYSSYYSVTLIPIADSVALQFTLPIFTAVFATLALKEPLYRHRLAAVLLGFAGVMIIMRPGISTVNAGTMIALAAALMFAIVDVSTRFLAGRDRVSVVLFYGFVLQLPIAAVPTAATWVTPGWNDAPGILAFALAALGAQICITKSFAAAEASLVSPVLYLRLPLSAVIAFVFFGEVSSVWTWAGAAILFACTTYTTRRDAALTRRRRASEREDSRR